MPSQCCRLVRHFVIYTAVIAVCPVFAADSETVPPEATASERPVEAVTKSEMVPAVVSGSETTPAEYVNYPLERMLDARLEAVQQATVSAQTSGRVIKLNYDVDDYVNKGDVLLQFRDREQKARFNSAQAGHKEAAAEYKRIRDVFNRKLVARSVLDKAEARLKAAKAALDQAKEELENTMVRAPYSGIVVKRHVEVGETARIGQPLFTGISLELLRASVELPQDMIAIVRRHKMARVIMERTGQRGVVAESLRISPYADPDSHTFNVRVNLPAGDYGVYPGMYVKVAFVVDVSRRLVVPVRAVAYRSEVSALYIQDKEGKLSFRQVRLGRRINDKQIEVLAGLDEAENVVLDPVRAAILLKEQQQEMAHE